MGIHGSAGSSPITPKVEDDDLPSIVGKFHFLAINIFSNDLRSHFPDGEFLFGLAFGFDGFGDVAALDDEIGVFDSGPFLER